MAKDPEVTTFKICSSSSEDPEVTTFAIDDDDDEATVVSNGDYDQAFNLHNQVALVEQELERRKLELRLIRARKELAETVLAIEAEDRTAAPVVDDDSGVLRQSVAWLIDDMAELRKKFDNETAAKYDDTMAVHLQDAKGADATGRTPTVESPVATTDGDLQIEKPTLQVIKKIESPRLQVIGKYEDPRLHVIKKIENPTLQVIKNIGSPRLQVIGKDEDPRLQVIKKTENPTLQVIKKIESPRLQVIGEDEDPGLQVSKMIENPALQAIKKIDNPRLQVIEQVEDPLILSQKIVSCVVRVEERFGAGYVAQVLHGSREQRILQNSHDKLSTWGILSEHDRR